ncbi:MAG: 1-deoxy-D-xylulose-5-phosphate synthase [Catenulispora sp.]
MGDVVLGILETIVEPADVRKLDAAQTRRLAAELRHLMIDTVARNGGHLGSNLGAVELTIAVHRVFDSPYDRIVFDTGHQSYVHKLLTGRAATFDTLRRRDGLSGYPRRAESEHDLVENSHASTALSYADGLSRAALLRGETDRAVVALVGDGALTGGLAWEGLNNLGTGGGVPVVVVLNDNGRSYSPTVGGVARHLAAVRAGRGPEGLFSTLGLAYLGPVDGHDVGAVEDALRQARALGRSVVVHCVTDKGHGYRPAELDDEERFHAPRRFDPASGDRAPAAEQSWTEVFSAELAALTDRRADVVALTAAMLHPTGLARAAARCPERVLDVGIAEQHAMTCAAGLALGGLHPVVAVYSTFLNRGFDQLLLDIGLHSLPVTVVLDRAGVTGDDGPSHHGVWDLALANIVPGLAVAAPRDATCLRELLNEAVAVADGPTLLRFPKGAIPEELPALGRWGRADVLHEGRAGGPLVIAAGAMAGPATAAARSVADRIGATVVDPRWVKPLDAELLAHAAEFDRVLVVEDALAAGGVGDAVRRGLAGSPARVTTRGLPARFLDHGPRAQLLADAGLDAASLAEVILADAAP